MTLIEALVVITVLGVTCTNASIGLHDDGLVGGIAGGVWALVGLVIVNTSIRLSFNLWYRLFPLRPPCATGKCTSDDYTFDTRAVDCLDWQCGCGDRYRQHWPKDGAPPRFTRLDDAGDELPFRVRRWMRWVSP